MEIANTEFKEIISQVMTDLTNPNRVYEPEPIEVFDAKKEKNKIMREIKNIIPNFVMNDYLRNILLNLFNYFYGFESEYNLKKGIYLYGNSGTGKTTLMKVFQKFAQKKPFIIVPVLKIESEYRKHGMPGLEKYMWEEITNGYSVKNEYTYSYCFDDLGDDTKNISRFGDKLDVMPYLLKVRYDIFIETKKLTHITTNMNIDTLLSRFKDDYNKLNSRFMEMFNFIEMKGIDHRFGVTK